MARHSRVRSVLLLLVVGGALLAGGGSAQAQTAHTMERTIELGPDGTVELIAERGRIHVRAWDQPTVKMTVEVEEWAGPEGDAPVRVEQNGSTVRLQTVQADPDGAGLWELIGLGGTEAPRTHFTLRVPASAALSITTQNGSVDVQGSMAEVTVESYSASVDVRDTAGEVTAATFSGPLRAENVSGPLTLATFSGDASVRGPAPTHEHTIASFSGDAEFIFPADAAFDLQTDVSWGGSVTSDFARPDSSAHGDGPVPIGGGGPRVTFESFSGSLTLRAEPE